LNSNREVSLPGKWRRSRLTALTTCPTPIKQAKRRDRGGLSGKLQACYFTIWQGGLSSQVSFKLAVSQFGRGVECVSVRAGVLNAPKHTQSPCQIVQSWSLPESPPLSLLLACLIGVGQVVKTINRLLLRLPRRDTSLFGFHGRRGEKKPQKTRNQQGPERSMALPKQDQPIRPLL
jgi:hypothetical protein